MTVLLLYAIFLITKLLTTNFLKGFLQIIKQIKNNCLKHVVIL